MGCGGSRADAIEPRYPESWTRETESTWLTSTEAETPNGASSSKNHSGSGEGGGASKENSKVAGEVAWMSEGLYQYPLHHLMCESVVGPF